MIALKVILHNTYRASDRISTPSGRSSKRSVRCFVPRVAPSQRNSGSGGLYSTHKEGVRSQVRSNTPQWVSTLVATATAPVRPVELEGHLQTVITGTPAQLTLFPSYSRHLSSDEEVAIAHPFIADSTMMNTGTRSRRRPSPRHS